VRPPVLLLSLVLALLLTGAAPRTPTAPSRPTDASLRRAWERNAHTVVEVAGKRGRGAGVIVGADGHIATSTHNVDLYEARVLLGGREVTAKVVSADARTRIAILQVPLADGAPLRAPEARLDAHLVRALWLVGISPAPGKSGTRPSAGQILQAPADARPHFLVNLPLPPGSPLFDERGRLVALVVERVGRSGALAVPLRRVQAQALQGDAP
jgi:hypothetical protein